MMVHSSLEAVDRLAADGFSCEVVDLRSLRPFDREAIVTSASKCGKVLVVQEANLAVSVASEVAAIISEDCFDSLDALKNADDSTTLESGDIVVTDQKAKAMSQAPQAAAAKSGKAGTSQPDPNASASTPPAASTDSSKPPVRTVGPPFVSSH